MIGPPCIRMSKSLVTASPRYKTFPVVHQADLAQALGKGALHRAEDEGMAELTAALNALSLTTQEAAQGSCVEEELSKVSVNLGIITGGHRGDSDLGRELVEQEAFHKPCSVDAQDLLMERVKKTFVKEVDPFYVEMGRR